VTLCYLVEIYRCFEGNLLLHCLGKDPEISTRLHGITTHNTVIFLCTGVPFTTHSLVLFIMCVYSFSGYQRQRSMSVSIYVHGTRRMPLEKHVVTWLNGVD
jgi:hypothetical protein